MTFISPRLLAILFFALIPIILVYSWLSSCQEERAIEYQRHIEGTTILVRADEWYEVLTYNGQCFVWEGKTPQDRIIAEWRDGVEWKWRPLTKSPFSPVNGLRFKSAQGQALLVIKLRGVDVCDP